SRDRVSSSHLSLSEVAAVRLGDRQIGRLGDSCRITGRVVASVGLTATRDAYIIGDAGGSVVGDGDRESDGRITGAGSQGIAAGTGKRAQHAGPASTSNVRGTQAGGKSVRYGDDPTGRSKARVSSRDRVSSSHLSLSEVTAVRLGDRQIRQLVNSCRITGRVV